MNGITSIALIVAGGKGTRMGSAQKKQFMTLGDHPILSRTLAAFAENKDIHEIVLVVPEADMAFCRERIITPSAFSIPIHLVAGGRLSRQESVYNGLMRAKSLARTLDKTMVLIHDGVRPFVSDELIASCLGRAMEKGGCIPVIELSDSIKEGDLDGQLAGTIAKTVDRSRFYRAQTPQVFRLDLILKAFEHAQSTQFTGTDDASVMEHAGFLVHAVRGSRYNIKITTKEDLAFAKFILENHLS
jgi:2-C-methyl-D-erythritol 4-phosphate cytidylyltransferase